jgi:hypothetical protein
MRFRWGAASDQPLQVPDSPFQYPANFAESRDSKVRREGALPCRVVGDFHTKRYQDIQMPVERSRGRADPQGLVGGRIMLRWIGHSEDSARLAIVFR